MNLYTGKARRRWKTVLHRTVWDCPSEKHSREMVPEGERSRRRHLREWDLNEKRTWTYGLLRVT